MKKHTFSVELKSKEYLNSVSIQNYAIDNVSIEGCLGELVGIDFVEGIMLEIKAVNGVLRVDLNMEEFETQLKKEEHRKV